MKKNVTNIVGAVLIAASFIFIANRFMMIDVVWNQLFTPCVFALLLTAPFLNIFIVFLNSFCWRRSLLLFTDNRIYSGDTFAVYAKANLAKYLPGNVGHYAARQMFGTQIGVRQLDLALASLFEIGYSSLSMLTLSLFFSASTVIALLKERFGDSLFLWCGLLVAAGAVVVVTLGFFFCKNRVVAEIIKLARRPQFWLTMLSSFMLSMIPSLLVGATFIVVIGQFATVDFSNAFLLIGGCLASYFIGFITPGTPGGIGVREAAMLLLLSPFFPSDVILLAAVIQRVIMIAGDVVAFPIGLLLQTSHDQ